MASIKVLLVALLSVLPLFASEVAERWIVELADEPTVVAGKASAGSRAAMRERAGTVRRAQLVARQLFAARGVEVLASVENVANALVVSASEAEAQALEQLPGVRKVHQVRLYKPVLDRAMALQGITDAWTLLGGSDEAGRGIKIGIIDTGIDATHPGFEDAGFTAPEGFPRVSPNVETANSNAKVIVARNYAGGTVAASRDSHGHGTGVAMIAAGRLTQGPFGPVMGVAPKAWLGNYRVFPDDEDAPTDYILRAIDDAVADGMDVINLSLGGFPAGAPDGDILVSAVERASQAGVIVVAAAGNEGPALGTIASPGTAPSAITVGNANNDRVLTSVFRISSGSVYRMTPGTGPQPAAGVTGQLAPVAEIDGTGLACAPLPPGSLTERIAVILRGECVFEQKLNNAESAGAAGAIVYTHAQDPGAITMSVGGASLPAAMLSNADGLDLLQQIKANPGVSGNLSFRIGSFPVDANVLSPSSSKGPSVDARIKPEVLAVGTAIFTATPGGFRVGTGTSFSSPMVAGAAAILRAVRPGLTVAQYKSLLVNSSAVFPAGLSEMPPVQPYGAGLMNLASSIKSTVSIEPSTVHFGSTGGTRRMLLTNLSGETQTLTVTAAAAANGPVPEISSSTVQVDPGGSAELTVALSGTGLEPGQYYGAITVRGTATEVRAPYWLGVAAPSAASIYVVPQASDAPRAGSRQSILVRPTDVSGLPVESEVRVNIKKGQPNIVVVRQHRFYPGFHEIVLTLDRNPGDNTLSIECAGANIDVNLVGN